MVRAAASNPVLAPWARVGALTLTPGSSRLSVTTPRAAGTRCGCLGVPLRRLKHVLMNPIGDSVYACGSA